MIDRFRAELLCKRFVNISVGILFWHLRLGL